MKVSFEHIVDVPVDKALAVYKEADFHLEKQKALGAISMEMLETEQVSDTQKKFKLRGTEKSRVPDFLHKSDVDSYVIDSVLDTTARTLTWKVTPEVMAKVFFLTGEVYLAASGDKTKIVYTTKLEVKVPFLGKKAEKIGLAQVEGECQKQTDFLLKWVASHPN